MCEKKLYNFLCITTQWLISHYSTFNKKSVKWLWLDLLLSTNSKTWRSCLCGFFSDFIVTRKINLMDEVFVGQRGLNHCKCLVKSGHAHTASNGGRVALVTASPDSLTVLLFCCFLPDPLPSTHLKTFRITEKGQFTDSQSNQYAVQNIAELCTLPPVFNIGSRDIGRHFFPTCLYESESVRCNSWPYSRWWFYGPDWWELVRGMLIAKKDEIFPALNSCPRL